MAPRNEIEELRARIEQLIRQRNRLKISQKDIQRKLSSTHHSDPKPSAAQQERRRITLLSKARNNTNKLIKWEDEYDAQIIAYAQALCKSLTNGIQTRLPREIRDQIYVHLASYLSLGSGGGIPEPFQHALFHHTQPPWIWHPKPGALLPFCALRPNYKPFHWEDGDFVDPEFAHDLLQMYFRVCRFVVYSDDWRVLDTWLRQEPMGYGVVVAENVKTLKLSASFVGCGSSDVYMNRDSPGNYAIDLNKGMQRVRKEGRDIAEGLKPLLRIRARCEVSLWIGIWAGELGYFQFGEVMAGLMSIVVQLKERGIAFHLEVQTFAVSSARCFSSWDIRDTSELPTDILLRDTLEELRLPCIDVIEPELVQRWESKFELDPSYSDE